MKPSRDDALTEYRAKRAIERTPEPAGSIRPGDGRLYVMQKHAARQLHFDLRLELDGVLKSWAVPRGPSYDQANKRSAIHVEDHPVEYADFEGIIPAGNYGAGAVILWDRGVWIPLEDPQEGFEKGKLLFELRGYKLRGRWTLVKTRRSEKDWLLIKERDALMGPDRDDFADDSILSGLTVDQLAAGHDRAGPIRVELERLGAPRRRVDDSGLEVMLAETADAPFSDPDWLFEIKYDGYRILAALGDGRASLRTRNGRDATGTFPEVARALAALPFSRLVLDGEVVAHDEAGRPSFQRLQKRGLLRRAADVRAAASALPVSLYLFDMIGFEDFDLRRLPLVDRKRLLRAALPTIGPLRYCDDVSEQGEALFEQLGGLGLEGMVAKRADSAYVSGRSAHWLKVRSDRTGDFVVVGYTTPKGTRSGFGALHLAAFPSGAGGLLYAGSVGSGFTQSLLEELRARLDGGGVAAPTAAGAPTGSGHTWVSPELVCEVRYKEWTEDGLLRHPVFLRMREDKRPEECVREGAATEPLAPVVAVQGSPEERTVRLTNLDKVFWPDEGYTKGDLVEYYRAVSRWMLPYLRDRPLVMTRYPDGIAGKSFFQKDAPSFAPDWIRREVVYSADSERELSYFVCDDEPSLLYVANSGSIPMHVWSSRVGSLETPDWCILDLDPKGAPFTDVVEIAKALKSLCDDIDLPVFVKTSGSSGLHALIPLGGQLTHAQSRVLGELLARFVVAELPEIATMARQVADREGRVYVDHLQNGHGKLLVAPFCVRPLPGAPVSLPLEWREVNRGLTIGTHTIRTVIARLKRRGSDPMAGVLELEPDLVSALARLNERGA